MQHAERLSPRALFWDTTLSIIALLLCAVTGYSQPTGNVLSRVFEIRFGDHSATTFPIDYGDRQYFVTARNSMESATSGTATVEIIGSGTKGWRSRPVTVLLGKNKCVDVAVLIPKDKRVSVAESIPYPYNYAIGQEAYFLGFPYGLSTAPRRPF